MLAEIALLAERAGAVANQHDIVASPGGDGEANLVGVAAIDGRGDLRAVKIKVVNLAEVIKTAIIGARSRGHLEVDFREREEQRHADN